MTTIVNIPPILKSMALAAANGSNKVWQGEWRRSSYASPYAWAKSLQWSAREFRDKWSAMYLVAVVGPGPEPTIDGQVVHVSQPVGMWSGCSLAPKFDTQNECEQWIFEHGLARETVYQPNRCYCGGTTHYYDGALGYEAHVCKRCGYHMQIGIEQPESHYEQWLKHRAANAWVTHCKALGHEKSARNEEAFNRYSAQLRVRGIAMTTEELQATGQFNGDGAW